MATGENPFQSPKSAPSANRGASAEEFERTAKRAIQLGYVPLVIVGLVIVGTFCYVLLLSLASNH